MKEEPINLFLLAQTILNIGALAIIRIKFNTIIIKIPITIMKKKYFLFATLILASLSIFAQNKVTIKGNVKFIEEGFKVTVFQRSGTTRTVLAETAVNPDHTYSVEVPVNLPGEAIVDCGQWQSVNVWLEDENLDIDFRGLDTAKVKIKNPPYVHIRGGKNNEVMNLINFESYRAYQRMIAISQATYRAKIEDEAERSKLSMTLYGMSSDNLTAYMRYIAEHYADRNSALVAISSLDETEDKALIEEALNKIEKLSPASKTLVDNLRKARAEKKEREERMKVGNPAPAFTCLNAKGKKMSPSDFKGKVLVLDFWASWCGPCRQEIPNMKKFYEEFKGKDVEFLSVSIDAKEEAWRKAMKEENMAWPQGWVKDGGKEVMNLYQFGGIPFILVIDKDGNIFKKNVRGENIKTAVQECLDGKKASAPKVVSMGMMGAAM
jgi:peroxiredoxin